MVRLTPRLLVISSARVSALSSRGHRHRSGPAFQLHHQWVLGAQVDLRFELERPVGHVGQPVAARHLI